MKNVKQTLFLLFILLTLFIFAMFQGGKVSWFMFFSFLPIFIYAIGLIFYPLKEWRVERVLNKQMIRAGDNVLLTVILKRRFPFPLFSLICEDVFPSSLKRIDNGVKRYNLLQLAEQLIIKREAKKVVYPGFKREIKIEYPLEKVPRGEHVLTEIKLRTEDLFGFVKKEHTFQLKDFLQVFPNERNIKFADQVSSYEQGPISSAMLHVKQANIVSGVREYIPGDKLSWVDWKQTARKNKIMSKEFEQEKSTDTLIILDSSKYPGQTALAYEGAVEIAMSLVELLQRRATNIGLVSLGDKTERISLQPDPNKREKMHQLLMRVEPSNNRFFTVQLKEEITRQGATTGQFALMLITTRLDETFKRMLMELKKRIKRIIVFVIRPSSSVTAKEYDYIQELKFGNIKVYILTEKELKKQWIEVSE